MKRNLRRLSGALVISCACFLSTVLWFEAGRPKRARNDKAPVARLTESANEVQRKEVKRVIWELVSRNDEFYPGEAIRTTERAEAKIQLLKSGTVIHLEPESLVVLEENDNGLALDFLQGNLFVQGGGAGAADVTLKSGASEIKLKSADMSLSKDKTGQVNLEVFKGQAELSQGGRKLDLSRDKSAVLSDKGVAESRERVQLLTPQAGQTLLLNVARQERLEVTWTPIPPEYTVVAEVGPTREQLARVGESARGDAGRMSITRKPGKYFLRLSARGPDAAKPALTSGTVPFAVEPKAAPVLVAPSGEAPFLKKDGVVEFKWVNRNTYALLALEIARDPKFTQIVQKPSLAADSSSWAFDLPDGVYHWRVTGFLKNGDKTEPLSSSIAKVQVVSRLELPTPVPSAPASGARLSLADVQRNGVLLKWNVSAGATRYRAHVETLKGEKIFENEIGGTSTKVTDLKPGAYRWNVTALADGRGVTSEPAEFTINALARVEWAGGSLETEYAFSTPDPTLSAHWKPFPGAAAYRFRAGRDQAWSMTKQTTTEVTLPAEGSFEGSVEAVDAEGQTIAESEPKTFVVKRLPLLPAPRWTSATPPTLKADGKGNLSFDWERVEGARQYLMILENPEGQIVDQKPVQRNGASVSRLKPGTYQIKLKSVDANARAGESGEPKQLEVPNRSDISAPKIKAVKVK